MKWVMDWVKFILISQPVEAHIGQINSEVQMDTLFDELDLQEEIEQPGCNIRKFR